MKSTTKKIVSVLMIAVLICVMASGCTAAADTSAGAVSATGNWASILMLLAVILIFYFTIMRPEKKKQKQQDEMRNALSVGDEITTIGGIIGKVVSVHEDSIVFETSEDRVRLEVTRWAVSSKK